MVRGRSWKTNRNNTKCIIGGATMKTINNNIRKYLNYIHEIDLAYDKKFDKLDSERIKEVQVYFDLIREEQKKLQEVK